MTQEKIVHIRYPRSHAGQLAVLREAKRFNWLSAGRRWRKTTLCMAIAVQAASRGAEILWGAPTYDQVRVGWDETKRAAGAVAVFNVSRMECRFPSGGVIRYRSLGNPDNARGHTADGVVIDEAADVAPSAWYDVIRPMLMTTQGWAWIIGTPKGRNWFYQEFERARTPPQPSPLGEGDIVADSMAWQAPSLGAEIRGGELIRLPHPLENKELAFSELREMWRTMPERSFRQEILAEFVEDGGGVFRGVRAACTLSPQGPQEGHLYVIGGDWGRVHDFSVYSVYDATERPVRQVKLERSNQVSWQMLLNRLRVLMDEYQPIQVLLEENSVGTVNIELLQSEGYPASGFLTTNATKKNAVDAFSLALERNGPDCGVLQLLNDEQQISELEAFTSKVLPSGLIQYAAPAGLHDDIVMADIIGWQAAKADYDFLGLQEETEDERAEREWREAMRKYGGEEERQI